MNLSGSWRKVVPGVVVAVALVVSLLAVLRSRPQQHVAPTPPRQEVVSHAEADVPAGPADAEEAAITDIESAVDEAPDAAAEVAEMEVLRAAEDLVMKSVSEQPQPRGLRTQARVDAQIAILRGETLVESLANLHDMDLFRWPGSGCDHMEFGVRPLMPDAAWYTAHEVMSNRRVVKVVQELSRLEKREAASIVSAELAAALAEHKRIFGEFLQKHADDFAPSARPHGIGFRGSNNPDGSPTLMGIRYKVFALVFAAGQLGLHNARAAVIEVCDCALRERDELYDETLHNIAAGVVLLNSASLYNRQILTAGLLGTSEDQKTIEEILKRASAAFSNVGLASWDAAATPYDVRFGEVPVDYSKGKLDVRYLREVSDETFDAVLEAAREP